MSRIPALGRWRAGNGELEANIGYVVNLSMRPRFLKPQRTARNTQPSPQNECVRGEPKGWSMLTPTCNLRIPEAGTRLLKFPGQSGFPRPQNEPGSALLSFLPQAGPREGVLSLIQITHPKSCKCVEGSVFSTPFI